MGAQGLDLSSRFVSSNAVVASPAAAAETIIASVTVAELEALAAGIILLAWAAFTVGTSGTSARLRLRRGNVAGAVVADSGALTGGVAAAGLLALPIQGFDAGPTLPNQVYVLTLTVGAAAAPSAVSAVGLTAIAV
jgi:hypothetical protein